MVPVVLGFCDLGENLQITMMLIQYPEVSASQVEWASRFTVIKGSYLRPLSMLLALGFLIWTGLANLIKGLNK